MCDAVHDERYSCNSLEYVCDWKGKTLYFLGYRVLYVCISLGYQICLKSVFFRFRVQFNSRTPRHNFLGVPTLGGRGSQMVRTLHFEVWRCSARNQMQSNGYPSFSKIFQAFGAPWKVAPSLAHTCIAHHEESWCLALAQGLDNLQ